MAASQSVTRLASELDGEESLENVKRAKPEEGSLQGAWGI